MELFLGQPPQPSGNGTTRAAQIRRQFACEQCCKVYTTKWNLKRHHTKIHLEGKTLTKTKGHFIYLKVILRLSTRFAKQYME